MGPDWSEYYILYAKTRDSGALERSNFNCILKDIDPNYDTDKENPNVIVGSFGHWACGWVEAIMIHESDTKAIEHGNDIQDQLDIYPVYDEDHYSNLEYEEAQEYWQEYMSLAEKVEACQEANISIFAARSKTMPAEIEYYSE